ncbi:MAG: hypothetical protein IE880_09250 [Epsilonproteobacteria bacterium]|nr:hypothetical protein [Campylobacterota bacterium]
MKKLKIVVVGIGRAGYATIDLLRKEKISSEIKTIKFNKDADSIRIVTVEELESAHIVNINGKDVVFGYINDQWENLKSLMKDGDHLVEFKSSPGSWANLAGRKGIRLMRGEEVIETMITRMN